MKRRNAVGTPPEGQGNRLSRRRFLWWLAALAALGTILRLWVAFDFAAINGGANNMLAPAKVTDMATYVDLARRIAAGTYRGEFYYQPFY